MAISVANRLAKVPGDGMRLPAFGVHQGESIQVLRPTKPGSVIFLGAICCSTRLRQSLCSASSLKKRFGKTNAELALEHRQKRLLVSRILQNAFQDVSPEEKALW